MSTYALTGPRLAYLACSGVALRGMSCCIFYIARVLTVCFSNPWAEASRLSTAARSASPEEAAMASRAVGLDTIFVHMKFAVLAERWPSITPVEEGVVVIS